jgi:hypothetical protein
MLRGILAHCRASRVNSRSALPRKVMWGSKVIRTATVTSAASVAIATARPASPPTRLARSACLIVTARKTKNIASRGIPPVHSNQV